MTLRPRYSLLTLLILTALVAGGVKLWRGPHWAVISGDTRTAEERKLLSKFPHGFKTSLYNPYGAFRYEYSYLQHWHEREFLTSRQFPLDGKRFPIVRVNQTVFYLLPDPALQTLANYPEADPQDLEFLHHVCYLPQCPERILRAAESDPIASLLPPRDDATAYPMYCISTKGQVYKPTLSNIILSLVRIDMTTLPANVREALKQEIAAATD